MPDASNYTVILRFLGTTPQTSNIFNTFQSIFHQLAKLFNLKFPSINSFKLNNKAQLKEMFIEQLMYISLAYPKKKLLFILDSIDQLSTADYDLEWVLDSLPHNVKMIYSTLTTHGNILITFKELLKLKETNLVEIKTLDVSLSKSIIKDWLVNANRSISPKQWQVLEAMFTKAKLFPLYIKLIFDIVIKWSSFKEPEKEFTQCLTIDLCIEYLFKCFEQEHGRLLFSRAIIYMSSFKNGISENEIEDILSLDDEVLYDIFEFNVPPIRKLPVALWSRIKHDLRGYMVEKEVDDTRVIYWYHRRFIEVAESYYIAHLDKDVFINVIDFFNETWKNKPKPYKLNDYLLNKKKLKNSEEVRDTSIQPTVFMTQDGTFDYNKRKINEFPGFISKLKTNIGAPISCEYIFLNYHFFTGMFLIRNINEIFKDIQAFKLNGSYTLNDDANNALIEISMIQLLLLQCGFTMKEYPLAAGLQFVSRSLLFYGHLKYFTAFIEQYDETSMTNCALIVPYQFMPEPASDLIFSFESHVRPISCACLGGEDDSFMFTLSDKLEMINLMTVNKNQRFIKIDKDDKSFRNYLFLIVYANEELRTYKTSMSDIEGGFIAASEKHIFSYSFQNVMHSKKLFDKETIKNISLIGSSHLMVVFNDKTYFDVYNIFNFELEIRKNFDQVILLAVSNSFKKEVNFMRSFEHSVYIAVVLESSRVLIFNANTSIDKRTIDIELNTEIPAAGVRFKHATFLKQIAPYMRYLTQSSIEPSFLCLTTEDGSFMLVKYDQKRNKKLKGFNRIKYYRPLVNTASGVSLTFMDMLKYGEKDFLVCLLVFLGSNGHIYVFILKMSDDGELEGSQNVLAEIPGNFENLKIISFTSNLAGDVRIIVAAFVKGIIKCFSIIYNYDIEKTYKYLETSEIVGHYDKIVFSYIKGKEQNLFFKLKIFFKIAFLLNSRHHVNDRLVRFEYEDISFEV